MSLSTLPIFRPASHSLTFGRKEESRKKIKSENLDTVMMDPQDEFDSQNALPDISEAAQKKENALVQKFVDWYKANPGKHIVNLMDEMWNGSSEILPSRTTLLQDPDFAKIERDGRLTDLIYSAQDRVEAEEKEKKKAMFATDFSASSPRKDLKRKFRDIS